MADDSPRTAALSVLRRAASTREPSASPSPSSEAPPTSLERSTSLLARRIAMAKLTGEPLPMPSFADNGVGTGATSTDASGAGIVGPGGGPMPTLLDLSTRVRLRRGNTVTGTVGARTPDGGTDTRTTANASLSRSVSDAGTGLGGGREAARVNLMRKLSERRLGGPTVSARGEGRLGVVAIGFANTGLHNIGRSGSDLSVTTQGALLGERKNSVTPSLLSRNGSGEIPGFGINVEANGAGGQGAEVSSGDEASFAMGGRMQGLSKEEEEEKERAWALKQKRLVAKVERKREEGLAREVAEGGAFPPPEVGYQFPSPVLASDREWSQLENQNEMMDDSVKALFAPSSPSPVTMFPPRFLPLTMTPTTTAPSSPEPPQQFESAPMSPSPSYQSTAGESSYSSTTEMVRAPSNASTSSSTSSYTPPTLPRVHQLPKEQLPSSRILAKLDSVLGTTRLAPPPISSQPTPLDSPRRKLLLHTPVLQVVNVNTVKDRHLFLFNDLLLIAKPRIEDDANGQPIPSTLASSFLVKSIVELKSLSISSQDDTGSSSSSSQSSSNKPGGRHPALAAFVDRFANDPKKAIKTLITHGGLPNEGVAIASLLIKTTDLNRNAVGAYLSDPGNKHILRAYIERFRFGGVRIDDALRMFLMTLRFPHTVEAAEYFLGVLAHQWTEVNGSSGFDPSLTYSLVYAIMRLSDALHARGPHEDNTLYSLPNAAISVDDFISAFKEQDPRLLVPEDLLTRIYASVRKERIEEASDNSMFSMTPDIEAEILPAKIPVRLTYRTPSDPITITIPEPDPKFSIKLHGIDLKFDPPVLNFAKSTSQTFRVTGSALGVRAMVLIKLGANAPRYQGLPLNKTFSIERAFLHNTFQISFPAEDRGIGRKTPAKPTASAAPSSDSAIHPPRNVTYMFSTLDSDVLKSWVRHVRKLSHACKHAPPSSTKALRAGEVVAVQVLRDALISPEEGNNPQTQSPALAAASPRPNTSSKFTGNGTGTPRRLGTPTRPGQGALVRSASFSKTYPAGAGKAEGDLGTETRAAGGKTGPGGGSGTATPMSRRPSAEVNEGPPNPFMKTGEEICATTVKNSLLPLMLSFLSAGAEI
ncbi:ARF guanyl-nucleotide exchange factor [Pseudohyphozyma bogoriensis]|nr:ARF guanyl-nucleotide exchange factor [Pseudohyphozyma bogoriensis]